MPLAAVFVVGHNTVAGDTLIEVEVLAGIEKPDKAGL